MYSGRRVAGSVEIATNSVWGGWGGVGGYDQLCCPASPKLLLGLDLGLGCDNCNSLQNSCILILAVFPRFQCLHN